MSNFILHPQLAKDGGLVIDLPLSRLLRMNDRQYPWLILVPRRNHMKEIIDLQDQDQRQLFEEILLISHILKSALKPDKINIGALGNMVPQLHIHLIARFKIDLAWPRPVWGTYPAQAFDEGEWQSELIFWKNQLALSSKNLKE